ncbi:MAG: hypothetical protein AAGA78_19290, partial [Pseudomonadota bacterium]
MTRVSVEFKDLVATPNDDGVQEQSLLAEGEAVPADTSRPLLTLDTLPLSLAQSEKSVDTIKGEGLTPLASA